MSRYQRNKDYRYEGLQEAFNGEVFPLYTDLITGSSFVTNKGETIDEALEECRKRFEVETDD
jgi:hypothetical protein